MEVYVGGDLEYSIKRFMKLQAVDGVLTSLRFRSLYPNLSDRRKAKEKRAEKKRIRGEKRRERAESYRHEGNGKRRIVQ